MECEKTSPRELSPQEAFGIAARQRLLEHAVAEWPRRGQKLIELSCGSGLFLEMFWQAGFDITGVDPSHCLISEAREKLGNRADLHIGHGDHLPFFDNEFDYVALVTTLERCDNIPAVLREAMRIARKGMVVAFPNKLSLAWLLCRRRPPALRFGPELPAPGQWYYPLEIRRHLIDVAGRKPMHWSCTLPGPPRTWRPRVPWRWCNGMPFTLPIGAFCAVSVDFVGERPLSPLYSLTREPNPMA